MSGTSHIGAIGRRPASQPASGFRLNLPEQHASFTLSHEKQRSFIELSRIYDQEQDNLLKAMSETLEG